MGKDFRDIVGGILLQLESGKVIPIQHILDSQIIYKI